MSLFHATIGDPNGSRLVERSVCLRNGVSLLTIHGRLDKVGVPLLDGSFRLGTLKSLLIVDRHANGLIRFNQILVTCVVINLLSAKCILHLSSRSKILAEPLAVLILIFKQRNLLVRFFR